MLWDLAARTPGKWLTAGNSEHIADVAFTPGGREVLTVLLEGGGVARRRVGSWRKKPALGAGVGIGRRLGHFDGHLAASPDGRSLVTSHCHPRHGAGLAWWGLRDGALRAKARTGHDGACQMAFSPDGRTLAVQENYRRVRLFDAETLVPLAKYVPKAVRGRKPPEARRIAFHPDGRLLAVSAGQHAMLLDAATLRPVESFDWGVGQVYGVGFSGDGALAAVGGADGRIAVWDID